MKQRIWVILISVFIVSLVAALTMGRYAIGIPDICGMVLDRVGLTGFLPSPSGEMSMVFWNVRIPRVIMAFAVGAGISVAGVVFQAIFRNPLASPDILGVSGGAAFGAALSIVFLTEASLGIQGFAFGFGILAVVITYFLAARSRDTSASVLVISGIVVWALSQSGLSLLEYLADPYDQLAKIMFWTMGSFQTSTWAKVAATLPIIIVGTLLLAVFSWRLNIMTQDERQILSLGVNVRKWRIIYITLSTLIVASAVSTVGDIKWVGLIMPHIARYLVGTEHKRLVPVSVFLGGSFMLLMDTLARTATTSEIPISILTSIVGAPFLGFLVLSRKGGVSKNDA
ncbi:MAG: iron ABC transporter permease [Syntrophomonadaceae bacterium]|nr:iron ABC transporter permease [Syntrophomonadaceae bacterium]